MVVARHIGRLGNCLFEIAAAIGYARKYGFQWAADQNSGTGEPYSTIHQVFPYLPKASWGGGGRYHEHPHGHCSLHNCSYDDCHFNYHPIPNLGPNLSLSGFFQSYKYFEGAEEEIKKVFALPHWVEFEDYVSIHVRRGDYVQHSGSFPPITKDYILQALGYLFTGGQRDFRLLFFSDDIQWCKDNFTNWQFTPSPIGSLLTTIYEPSIEFVEPGDIKNLSKMASCRHHIIANSSFSWWGAFLGHNPDRIVISPSQEPGNWFGPDNGNKYAVVDLLPPTWHQIKFR